MKQVTLQEVEEMLLAAAGEINAAYIHWSGGHYDQPSDHYHFNINETGKIFASTDDLTERKNHTYKRNTGAIGIAINCCAFANTNDLGDRNRVEEYGIDHLNSEQIPYEPPTPEQGETAAQLIALIARVFGWEIAAPPFMTHAEIATIDDYGPGSGDPETRWDLWFLPWSTEKGSGGDWLRQRAKEIYTFR